MLNLHSDVVEAVMFPKTPTLAEVFAATLITYVVANCRSSSV